MDCNLDHRDFEVSKGHGASCLRRKEHRKKEEEEEEKGRKEDGETRLERGAGKPAYMASLHQESDLSWVIYDVYEAEDGPLTLIYRHLLKS